MSNAEPGGRRRGTPWPHRQECGRQRGRAGGAKGGRRHPRQEGGMRIDFEELSIPGLDTLLTGTAHVDFDPTFAEPMVTSVSLTDPGIGRIEIGRASCRERV